MINYYISPNKYFYKLVKNKKIRISYNEFIKKQKNKKLIGGDKELQDQYIQDLYIELKTYDISTLIKNINRICDDLYDIILIEEFEFENNYLSKLIINLFIPVLYNIFNKNSQILNKIKDLELHTKLEPEYGRLIKEYELTNLTPNPVKSLKTLNSCSDTEKYCVMNPSYLVIDLNEVKYLCNNDNTNNIESPKNKILKIRNRSNFTNGYFLYTLNPDETLYLFSRTTHHSTGSCGQPVICAGEIIIDNNKIIKINNLSGHYKPPHEMLLKAIEILKRKGLIIDEGHEDIRRCNNYIKNYIF
jgi:hypothetical protein